MDLLPGLLVYRPDKKHYEMLRFSSEEHRDQALKLSATGGIRCICRHEPIGFIRPFGS